MNNPGQYLIHMTSRGPKVFNQGKAGSVGLFKCMVQQPLKDINKFGLLHYSIPKVLDVLQTNNNSFFVTLTFGNGASHSIPVRIPLLDYYNATVSQEFDIYRPNEGNRSRKNILIGFDEVLQTSINWSIQKYFSDNAQPHNNQNLPFTVNALARISCIVEFDPAFGTYKFTFGFRGSQTVANPGTGAQSYNNGAQANSGCPFVSNQQGTIAANVGTYTHRAVNGTVRNLPAVNLVNNLPEMKLISVAFEQMSLRLQLMLGASHESLISSLQKDRWDVVTRGRIRLVNYETSLPGAPANSVCGMVEMQMSIPPNLAPPAMIYLQLQVPGTKTKILGQSDERGGWAVPTPPNAYMSRYLNFPNDDLFSPFAARSMPKIALSNNPLADYQQFYANAAAANLVESGYMYDPIPIGPVDAGGVRQVDNFDCTNYQTASRMIMFGIHRGLSPVQSISNPQAGAVKRFDTDSRNFVGDGGFGKGLHRNSQVFTASMIAPNWVFTNTQDSTIQTFDIQLLWGDTSDPLEAVIGNPVQFSIIASP